MAEHPYEISKALGGRELLAPQKNSKAWTRSSWGRRGLPWLCVY